MSPRIQIAVASGVVTLILAALRRAWALADHEGVSFGCRLLPNAAVSYAGVLDPDCPLRPYERIEGLEVDGSLVPIFDRAELLARARASGASSRARAAHGQSSRDVILPVAVATPDHHRMRVAVIGLMVFILLGAAAAIALRRRDAVGPPLAVLCSGASLLLAGSFESVHTPLLDAAWLMSHGLLPAAVTRAQQRTRQLGR